MSKELRDGKVFAQNCSANNVYKNQDIYIYRSSVLNIPTEDLSYKS